MAETGTRADPLLAFRFALRFDGLAGDFAECSGLALEIEVTDYAEGGRNDALHKFATRTKQSPLVLRKGIVDRALWDWFIAVSQGAAQRRSGSVIIRDTTGRGAAAEWYVWRALPTKWTGPDLNAAQSAVAVETLELVHDGLERRA